MLLLPEPLLPIKDSQGGEAGRLLLSRTALKFFSRKDRRGRQLSRNQPSLNISVGVLCGNLHRVWHDRERWKEYKRNFFFCETVQMRNQTIQFSTQPSLVPQDQWHHSS